MSKLIKSDDGFIWLDVTDKAVEVYATGLFPLYNVWNSGSHTFRIPIEDIIDLDYALNNKSMVCIEVGNIKEGKSLDFVTIESWDSADKITHDGHVYVRYKDLSFCK